MEQAWSDRLRRLTAAAPGIAYEFRRNPDGSYCLPFASDRMYEFFGIPIELLAEDAQHAFNRVHPEDLPELMRSIQRSERTMAPWRHEFRLRHQKGHYLWFLGQSIPTKDPDGGITWRGFLLDVTEFRKLSETLRDRDRFLANLLESLPVGVVVIRKQDERVVLINAAGAAMVSHSAEQLLNMRCRDVLCGGRLSKHCPFGESASEAAHQDELLLVQPDGTPIPVLRQFRTYSIPGDQDYYLMVFTDIRERKRLETALRDSESRYRELADSIPALVWISGPDGACVDFNRTWLEFRGRTLEQEKEDGWLEGVHPDDRERVTATYRNALQARAPFVMTYRLLRHDGVYRWIEDHGVPRLDTEGNFLGYAGGCMDITDRQEAQAYLEAVMAGVQAGVFVSDARTDILIDVNNEAARLAEQPRDSLVGRSWRDIITRDRGSDHPGAEERGWDGQIVTPKLHLRRVRVRETVSAVGGRDILVQSAMDITDLHHLLSSQQVDIALARQLLDDVVRPMPRHVNLGRDLSLFVDARVWPCAKAGGDHALVRNFGDLIGSPLTALALCDQSGHEVNCVLRGIYTTLTLDTILRGSRRTLQDRLELFNSLLELSGVFREEDFVTGWFGDIDHDTGILTYAACGHPPAFLIREGQVALLPDAGTPGNNGPCGFLAGTAFTTAALRLLPGDRVIAFTDGLAEMPYRNRKQRFTAPMLARLVQAIIDKNPDLPVSELTDVLLATITTFSGESVGGPNGDNSSADDVSILAFEIESLTQARQWILHPGSDRELAQSVTAIARELVPLWEKQGIRSPEFRLRSVLEEGLSNIWIHGHRKSPDIPIRVRAWVRNDCVLELAGAGEGFEPERVPDPRLPDRILADSGRGIFMIRRAADFLDWFDAGRAFRAAFRRPAAPAIPVPDPMEIMTFPVK